MKSKVKAGVKDGLSYVAPVDQKVLRSETNEKSQRPVCTKKSVKSDRGTFTLK